MEPGEVGDRNGLRFESPTPPAEAPFTPGRSPLAIPQPRLCPMAAAMLPKSRSCDTRAGLGAVNAKVGQPPTRRRRPRAPLRLLRRSRIT